VPTSPSLTKSAWSKICFKILPIVIPSEQMRIDGSHQIRSPR
jgi:hypothetical protein